ncbi:MAG: hypothetical protein AAF598_02940, partial [Bacteroidota bacterium]
ILNLSNCNLGNFGSAWQKQGLPPSLNKLLELEQLYLDENDLRQLPTWLEKLERLHLLSLRENKLDRWPTVLKNMSNLQSLDLSGNAGILQDEKWDPLDNLRELRLARCQIKAIPENIQRFSGLQWLELQNNQIRVFPIDKGPGQTFPYHLQKLNLKNNLQLEDISSLGSCSALKWLDISNTAVKNLPDTRNWTNLVSLNIRETEIEHMPRNASCWGKLKNLQYKNKHPNSEHFRYFMFLLTDLNKLKFSDDARLQIMEGLMDLNATPELSGIDYLKAMNAHQDIIRTHAMIWLSRKNKDEEIKPIRSTSKIVFSGTIHGKERWIELLSNMGVTIQKKVDPETTHLIVGRFSYYNGIGHLLHQLTVLTVRDLYLQLKSPETLEFNASQISNIRQMLHSEQEDNQLLALEMINSLNIGHLVVEDLFFLRKQHLPYTHRELLDTILHLVASEELLIFLCSDQSLIQRKRDNKLNKTLLRYQQVGLDADRIALLCFHYYGTGARYIFYYGGPEVQHQFIQENIKDGRLDLSMCGLRSVPKKIYQFGDQIRELNLSNNALYRIPQRINQLTQLERLDLGFNKISKLPNEIGDLTNLKALSLSGNPIQELPNHFGNLDQLQILTLRQCQQLKLGDWLYTLNRLFFLDLFGARIKHIPDSISACKLLAYLSIYGHELKAFPKGVLALSNLLCLDLRPHQSQQWQALPDTLHFPKIECLLFGNLSFASSPDPWVAQMQKLLYIEGADVSHDLQQKILLRQPGNKYILHAGHVNAGFDLKDAVWKIPGFKVEIQ